MKKIRTYGHKVLRVRCEEIGEMNESVLKLVRNLKETLLAGKGLGLAAPQIGVKKRVFVALEPETKKLITVINPILKEVSGKEIDMEGCLSFPEIFFSIQRAKKATISGLDQKGHPITVEDSGVLARCFQHECDHLNGVLIVDYASPEEKKFWKEMLDKLQHLTS